MAISFYTQSSYESSDFLKQMLRIPFPMLIKYHINFILIMFTDFYQDCCLIILFMHIYLYHRNCLTERSHRVALWAIYIYVLLGCGLFICFTKLGLKTWHPKEGPAIRRTSSLLWRSIKKKKTQKKPRHLLVRFI